MVFTEKLKMLLSEKGITWKELSETLSIGKNQFACWQEKNSLPDGKTLKKIAEYFQVSADYLLGIDIIKEKAMVLLDNPEISLSSDEKWFILQLRQLEREGKVKVESCLVDELRRQKEKTDYEDESVIG